MLTSELCGPALIYLCFSLTQVVVDSFKGFYNTAFLKMWMALIITILLNTLCMRGLGSVAWIIVFIPFFTMTVITSLLLYYFGLDPKTGKISISGDAIDKSNDIKNQQESVEQETEDIEDVDEFDNVNLSPVSTTTENDASTEYNNLKEHCERHGTSPYEGIECPVTSSEGFSLNYSSLGN